MNRRAEKIAGHLFNAALHEHQARTGHRPLTGDRDNLCHCCMELRYAADQIGRENIRNPNGTSIGP